MMNSLSDGGNKYAQIAKCLNFEVAHTFFYVYALVTKASSFLVSCFPFNMSFTSNSTNETRGGECREWEIKLLI